MQIPPIVHKPQPLPMATSPAWLLAASTILVLLLCPSLPGLAQSSGGFNPDDWLQGADGWVQGLERAEKEGKTLVVYFYADWCGYCRQFENNLLGTPTLKSYLKKGYAVRINPEKGERESGIAKYYGVRGYPAFFVYGQNSKRLKRVERFRMVDGRPELLSPEEFIARISEAAKG